MVPLQNSDEPVKKNHIDSAVIEIFRYTHTNKDPVTFLFVYKKNHPVSSNQPKLHCSALHGHTKMLIFEISKLCIIINTDNTAQKLMDLSYF